MADLRSTRTSLYWRNLALSALIASIGGAKIKVYTGAQVATPETAATGTLLVTMTAGAAGTFGVVAGVLSSASVTPGVGVAAGNAGWFRVMDSTETNVLFDGTIGSSADADTSNLELPTIAIAVGMSVGATSISYTLPMQGV